MISTTILAVSIIAQAHQHGAAAPAAPVRPAPSRVEGPLTGLGTHHHTIATASVEAQRLFNQGT